ncbi:TIGR02530 family flagellar biosynthesis protein [Clostridium sp. AL.422]|uniref:TIGR02530 family flagellar biosynthesis protein n=1 Tax=Clostridium TaxID=1485 RepID=UPI00293DFA8B|nr:MULTISPECIES: TIGR02530 family flagellar biosynthesis protein [unclassified Clostridium]MDV4149699.1 TIGR02530 family flagellar biosynthesis protein [Clostridium sp. AL.422]
MGFRVVNGQAYPIGNFQLPNESISERSTNNKINFNDVLKDEIKKGNNQYTLSKHAADRLRDIDFTEADMKEIGKGFKIAEEKGSKNSVMIYKDVALIASIENKTVITAIEKDRAKDNIYTNIDSVVIL